MLRIAVFILLSSCLGILPILLKKKDHRREFLPSVNASPADLTSVLCHLLTFAIYIYIYFLHKIGSIKGETQSFTVTHPLEFNHLNIGISSVSY